MEPRCRVFAGVKVMLGPSLHALKQHAEKKKFRRDYVAKLVGVAQPLLANKVPLIFSLMHLAHLTGTSWSDLRSTITRDSDDYCVFTIRKRSGGNRRICSPRPSLRVVQAWIHQNILCSPGAIALMHSAAKAYAPGSSILDNANAHAGAAWLIKLDIKDFFESISERQVYHVFRKLGYPALLSFEMARLCTRVIPPRKDNTKRHREKLWRWTSARTASALPYPPQFLVGHLPQGAPTSAMLANLVVVELDKAIQVIADESGATYTRYADDIVLSLAKGTRYQSGEILRKISSIVSHLGYRVNREKCSIRGPGSRKIVTGLVINDAVPRLPRAIKDRIRLSLFHIRKHGLMSHAERSHSNSPIGYLNHFVGVIYFARSIEPEFGTWALSELRKIIEPHRELITVLREFDSPSKGGRKDRYSAY